MKFLYGSAMKLSSGCDMFLDGLYKKIRRSKIIKILNNYDFYEK